MKVRRLLFYICASFIRIHSADYTWAINVNGSSAAITKYTGPGGSITIPAWIGGYTVTTIAQSAFFQRGDVTSVVVPDSVLSIENYAFSSCTNLASVTLGANVEQLGYSAFASCPALTTIDIPARLTGIRETPSPNARI